MVSIISKAIVEVGVVTITFFAAIETLKYFIRPKRKITLGYWKCRGLAQPVRYLLEHIGHPW